MFSECSDGSIDEDRSIRNDLGLNSRRQASFDLVELLLNEINNRNCVHAGLPADIEPYPFFALHHIPCVRLCKAVLNPPDVAYSDRRSVDICDNDVGKLADGIHPAQGPHSLLARAANDAPSRNFYVLTLNRTLNLIDGDGVCIQFLGVSEKADLAGTSSTHCYRTDAIHGLQHAPDLLVCDFSRFAEALVADDRDGQHRRGVRIGLLDDWRVNVGRKIS